MMNFPDFVVVVFGSPSSVNQLGSHDVGSDIWVSFHLIVGRGVSGGRKVVI
jgi:hypothetical protein